MHTLQTLGASGIGNFVGARSEVGTIRSSFFTSNLIGFQTDVSDYYKYGSYSYRTLDASAVAGAQQTSSVNSTSFTQVIGFSSTREATILSSRTFFTGTGTSAVPISSTFQGGTSRYSAASLGSTNTTVYFTTIEPSFYSVTSSVYTAISDFFGPTIAESLSLQGYIAYFTTSGTRTLLTLASSATPQSSTRYLFPLSLTSKSTSDTIYSLTGSFARSGFSTSTITFTYVTGSLRWYGRGFDPIPRAEYDELFDTGGINTNYGWKYEFAMSKYPTSPADLSPYFTFDSDNTSPVTSLVTSLEFSNIQRTTTIISSPSPSTLRYPTQFNSLTGASSTITQYAVGANFTFPARTFIAGGGLYTHGSSIDINNHTSVFQNGVDPSNPTIRWQRVNDLYTSSESGTRVYSAGLPSVYTFNISTTAIYSRDFIGIGSTGLSFSMLRSSFAVYNVPASYYVPSFSKIKADSQTFLCNSSRTANVFATTFMQSVAGTVFEFPNIKTTQSTTVSVLFTLTTFVSPFTTTATLPIEIADTITQSFTSFVQNTSETFVSGSITRVYRSFTVVLPNTSSVLPTSSTSYGFTVSMTTLNESNLSSSLTLRSIGAVFPVANANLALSTANYDGAVGFTNDLFFTDTFGTSYSNAVNIGTKTSSGFYGPATILIYKSTGSSLESSVSPYEYLYPTSTQSWVVARSIF